MVHAHGSLWTFLSALVVYVFLHFGLPPLGREASMKLLLSVGQCVSMSVCQLSVFFSKVAHRNFLNFYIKLEGLKDQKLTETSFSEKFLFLGKKL